MTDAAELPPVLALFAEEFRLARLSAGLTQGQLAEKTHYTRGHISMVEAGQRTGSRRFVEGVDEVLGSDGRLCRLWALASRETQPGWAVEMLDAEQRASSIRSFQPHLIGGLFQTERYARGVFGARRFLGASDDDVQERVARRLARQVTLTGPMLRRYWLILDQAVLHRIIDSADVMREQLRHLLTVIREHGHVNVQVLPWSAGAYPAVAGPMTILEVPDADPVVHLEDPLSGTTTSRPETVQECVDRFDVLRSQALSLSESEEMIEARVKELS